MCLPEMAMRKPHVRKLSERWRSSSVLGVTKTGGQEKVREEDTTHGDGHKNGET